MLLKEKEKTEFECEQIWYDLHDQIFSYGLRFVLFRRQFLGLNHRKPGTVRIVFSLGNPRQREYGIQAGLIVNLEHSCRSEAIKLKFRGKIITDLPEGPSPLFPFFWREP